jgi:hypothetical protein
MSKADLTAFTEDAVCIRCLQSQVIFYSLKENGNLHWWEASANVFEDYSSKW